MTFATSVRDARVVLDVTRRQAALVRAAAARRGDAARRKGAATWLRGVYLLAQLSGTAAVPFCAWAYRRGDGKLWLPFAALAVLLYCGQRFAWHALDLSATDVLRQPSKAGVVFARLWRRLPVQLAIGACWALALAILLGGQVRALPLGAVPLLLAVAIAPSGWLAGRLAARLAGGDVVVLSPLLVPALAGVLVWSRVEVGFDVGSIVVLVLIAPLAVAAAATLVVQWLRGPRVHAGVLVAELATLPRFAFAVVLLLPRPELAVQWLASSPAAAFLVSSFALATLALALSRIARDMPRAEATTPGTMVQRADVPAPARPRPVRAAAAPAAPTVHRGRSPLRAAWFAHRVNWTPLRGARLPWQLAMRLPAIVATVLAHVWGPLLGVLAAIGNSELIHHRLLAIAAGLTAPAFVGSPIDRYRHRLGVDYVEQVRLRLFALAVFAVLPTCAAAGVAALLAGPDRWRTVVLAVLAATFALRAGWRGLVRAGETGTPSRGQAFVLLALGAALAVPLPSLAVPAGIVVLGVLGLALRTRRWNERTLVAEQVAAEERHARLARAQPEAEPSS